MTGKMSISFSAIMMGESEHFLQCNDDGTKVSISFSAIMTGKMSISFSAIMTGKSEHLLQCNDDGTKVSISFSAIMNEQN